ncbi:hypothetical protein UlMin_040184 [Ulmus minor]
MEQQKRWNLVVVDESNGCQIPAIFNFGDSNSDTGGRSAAFMRIPSPFGSSYFGQPSGRYSDGRLILDFMVEKLNLPDLKAYLDSIGSNFRHGANFASGGSTIQPVDGKMFEAKFSPFSLDVQIMQFLQLKARTSELYSQGKKLESLPKPEDFSRALYTIDIGQNDLYGALKFMPLEQVKASLSSITNKLASAIEQLYQQGARTFWIYNTGPVGCLPSSIIYTPSKPEDLDQIGCLKSHNEVAQEFNRQLKEIVSLLRSKISDAVLTYIDIYSAKFQLISEAEKHGFIDPLGVCCGKQGDSVVHCGMKAVVDGKEVYGQPCSEPAKYISWDGVHFTHAANQWVAHRILNGSFSDPPFPINQVCQKHPSS